MATMSPQTSNIDHNTPESYNSTEEADATLQLAEAVAVNCQQLAERLKRKDSGKHQRLKKTSSSPVESDKDASHETDAQQKYQQAREENIRLRAVLQDVTEANKRWQQYNKERQTYMQRLMNTVRELKKKTGDGSCSSDDAAIGPPDATSEDVAVLKIEYEKALQEIGKLQRQLDEAKRKITHLSAIVSKTKSDTGEQIELLQMQVQAHRDDWEAEREEKQKILKRDAHLSEQLSEAKAKIKDLQRELHRRDSCLCNTRNGLHTEPIIGSRHSSPATYNIPVESKLIPRSPSYRSPYQYSYFDDELATDSASPMSSERVAGISSSGNNTLSNSRTKESFKCPECETTFRQENHQSFLEHFEMCQKGAL